MYTIMDAQYIMCLQKSHVYQGYQKHMQDVGVTPWSIVVKSTLKVMID